MLHASLMTPLNEGAILIKHLYRHTDMYTMFCTVLLWNAEVAKWRWWDQNV